jgi:adenine/guanine phosphoribosyltransferase-like PRPP-binding protein
VVVVDDVITTGSTVKAIARVLRRAGVERVDVLSFARVVPGEGGDDGVGGLVQETGVTI